MVVFYNTIPFESLDRPTLILARVCNWFEEHVTCTYLLWLKYLTWKMGNHVIAYGFSLWNSFVGCGEMTGEFSGSYSEHLC